MWKEEVLGMEMKVDAKTERVRIWEELLKVAKPDSKFSWQFSEFICDYEGSEKGTALLTATDMYKNAKVIFITPDNNLETLREQAFRDKKTVVMTNYGITRGFFLIRPEQIPEGKEEVASLLDGVSRYWKHQTLAQLQESVGHIDMMVTGASAITPSGIRFGKGHGYFDLEWAMLSTKGIADSSTVIIGAVTTVRWRMSPSPWRSMTPPSTISSPPPASSRPATSSPAPARALSGAVWRPVCGSRSLPYRSFGAKSTANERGKDAPAGAAGDHQELQWGRGQ